MFWKNKEGWGKKSHNFLRPELKRHAPCRQHQNFSTMYHRCFTPTWAPSRTGEEFYRAMQVQVQRRTLLLLRLPPGRLPGQLPRPWGNSPRWRVSGFPVVTRAFGTQTCLHRGTHSVSRAQFQAHSRVRKTSTQSPPLLDSSVYPADTSSYMFLSGKKCPTT